MFHGKTTGSGRQARSEALVAAFARAESATGDFAARSGLGCPDGCGACCVGFMPEILPVEAEYMAEELIRADPSRATGIAERGFDAASGTCPLHLEANPFHCSAYSGRPLVCRLFGFAGTRDKHGRAAFRPCRHMPPGAARYDPPGCPHPPVMADFGALVEGIAPGETADRAPISHALPNAVRRLLLARRLAAEDRGEPEYRFASRPQDRYIEAMKQSFTVPSMSCENCKAHIESALGDSGKASSWTVDLGTKVVNVETGVDRKEIADILAEAGYPPLDAV